MAGTRRKAPPRAATKSSSEMSPRQAAKQRSAALDATYKSGAVREFEELECSTDESRHHVGDLDKPLVVKAAERMAQVWAERGRNSY